MASCHHVVYRDGELTFYVPALFEHSLHYGSSGVHLLMADLLERAETSKKVCSTHYQGHVSCVFWKNHPIGRVCVLGIVMGIKWRWINNEDYVFLFMDDFSSKASQETKFLVCKCLKEMLVGQGLPIGNLVGKRLRIYGEMNIRYGELEVEVVEICDSLTEEIEHWQRSLELVSSLNDPWELNEQVLQGILTQGSSCNIDYEEVTNFTTPVRLKARRDFIEELQVEKYKEELEIVSPYRDASSQEVESLDSGWTIPRVRHVCEDSLSLRETLLVGTQSPVMDAIVEYEADNQSIFACSENQARAKVLKHLLGRPERALTIVEIYQMSQINDIVANISAMKFKRQNLTLVKPLDQLKTETFFKLIGQLVTSGLLTYINRNVVNLSPLKALYAYCTRRLRALVKLQCYLGTIDFDYIRQKLALPTLSQKAIIDTFKETLRVASFDYPRLITGWWIEMSSDNSSLVHLEYNKALVP